MKKSAITRSTILNKAFGLIYQKGYQPTSIDEIIAATKVTKGAFFYHFKNKEEMGLAIINEILMPTMQEHFIKPLQEAKDPLDALYRMMKNLLLENKLLKPEYGCPVGNLNQELAPWNDLFSNALQQLTRQWEQTLVKSIEKGKRLGFVKPGVKAEQVAVFVISGYWGIRTLGKVHHDQAVYKLYLNQLKAYLDSLK